MVRNPSYLTLFQLAFLAPSRQKAVFRPPLSSGRASLCGHQQVQGSSLPEREFTWRDQRIPSPFPPVSVGLVLAREQHLCPSTSCQEAAVTKAPDAVWFCILQPIWLYILSSGTHWRDSTITISCVLAASLVINLAVGGRMSLVVHHFLDQDCPTGSSH